MESISDADTFRDCTICSRVNISDCSILMTVINTRDAFCFIRERLQGNCYLLEMGRIQKKIEMGMRKMWIEKMT